MKNSLKIMFSICLILSLLVSSHHLPRNFAKIPNLENLDTILEEAVNQETSEISVPISDAELLQQHGVDLQSLLQQNALKLQGANGEVNGTYELIWEPNRIQGSVHSVAVYGSIVAIGAGYFYDNEIHIYRWNSSIPGEAGLTHVWDVGDGIFKSDVLSLAFGDTDRDSYIDITAGCADGQIYVFEQKSRDSADLIYYEFQLVWSSNISEIGKRISSIAIDDLDSDGFYEIIAGAWTQKIYIYEYYERYGMSGASNHRHYYRKVWDSGEAIKGLVNSVDTGDTDADGFKEVIAGVSDNKVYIFENDVNTSPEPVYPHVDNAYSEIWNSTNKILGPIQKVAVDNQIDDDAYGEIVALSSGHGAFVLEYAPALGGYVMSKLMRAVESWETNPPFPIDIYIDLKVWGNNITDGVFEPGQGSGPNYPVGNIPEPYRYLGQNATAMAGPSDWYQWDPFKNVTLLKPTAAVGGVAKVALDFGKDEEVTGGGNSFPDLAFWGFEIMPKSVNSENFFIYVSQDGVNFSRINEEPLIIKSYYDYHGTYIRYFLIAVDVDPTLDDLGWEWFRYIKLETTTEVYIDAIRAVYLYRPVSDAMSVSIGFIPGLNITSSDTTSKIVIGTSTGTLKVFSRSGLYYVQIWDSYKPIPLYQPGTDKYRKRFSMGNNIWDISLAAPWPPFRRFIVVGTYPKVAFIEVNTTTLEASSIWDTGNVLAKWTMAVDLADTDSDGVKEVVVGSFDSNIYVFDHVYRNTYRRAWRSPDLKHNQTFWDHVTDIILGDYDDDDKLELIASTNNQTYPILHIFENIGNNQFAPSETIQLPQNSGPVTAVDLGNDLDADGAKEIIALAQKKVYTFEKKNSVIISNSLQVTSRGRALAVVTGDSDKDGFGEIIVGGYDEIVFGFTSIRFGFVSIYENYGNATVPHLDNQYRNVWNAPIEHMVKGDSFSVRTLALDDQNGNARTEIIVGHDCGITIYENTGNDSFESRHFVTSSASYPTYTPTQVGSTLPNNYCPTPVNRWEGWRVSSAPVVQLPNGTYVMVYTGLDTSLPQDYYHNRSRLFYTTSQDGVTWSTPRRVTADSWYHPQSLYWLYYERAPSVVVTPAGQVWIAYEARFVVTYDNEFPSIEDYLWVCVVKLWTTRPEFDLSKTTQWTPDLYAYKAVSPSIFWNSTSETLGLTYLNYTTAFSGRNVLYLCKSTWNITIIGGSPPFFIFYSYPDWKTPQPQNSAIGSEFIAYSQKTVYMANSTLAVVFSGQNISAPRDPDIWYMTSNVIAGQLQWTKPKSISISTDGEEAPYITLLKGDVLAVVYRRIVTVGPHLTQWQIYITASADYGMSWTTPQALPTSADQAYAPSIYGLRTGGFMYAFHSSTSQSSPSSPKIYFAKNPIENWWLYTIGQVQCLAVGDTDGDQNHEIIAGSLNQVYILELTDFGGGKLNYTQKWVSQPLPKSVTDIAIGDINNDGTEEIVVTAESGNLYAFRWKKQE